MGKVMYFPIVGVNLATNTTGDKATLVVPFKCVVKRAFVVVNTASVSATAFVIKFDKRPTAGSDTGRGDGDVAVISKTASVDQQGKYLYEDPSSRVTLDEGEQVMVEVTTANGDACAVDAGILVEYTPEIPANNSAMAAA